MRTVVTILGILLSLLTVMPEAQAKYTVCTATINSDNEARVFRASLNSRDFNFVELTDFSSDKQKKDDDWFRNACEQRITCDVLIISGHFGGSFFGASGLSLHLSDLNRYSCQNRCDGIMTHPKEVYLFGCNTLATKEKDHRDASEYLRVLVGDGIDRAEAERQVAVRYGPFGSSFKDQIQRVFEGVPHIYGFHSVGPAGNHVEKSLQEYLSRLGDYKSYLDRLDGKSTPNAIWADSMKEYSSAQGSGLQRSNPAYVVKENICAFNDNRGDFSERVQAALGFLEQDTLTYLPVVSDFVNSNLADITWMSQERRADINRITSEFESRTRIHSKLIQIASSNTVTPSIRMDILKATYNLGWLAPERYDAEMRNTILPWIKSPETSNVDLVCSIVQQDHALERFIQPGDFSAYTFDTANQFRIAQCLDLSLDLVSGRMLEGALRYRNRWKTPQEIAYVLLAVSKHSKKHSEVVSLLKSYRIYTGPYRQELMRLISTELLKHSTGQEQISLVKAALKPVKTLRELFLLTWAFSYPELVELETAKSIILKAIEVSSTERPGSYETGKILVVERDEFESWLSQMFERLPSSVMLSVVSAFLQQGYVRTAILQDAMIKYLIYRSEEGARSVYPEMASVLANSELNQMQNGRLERFLDSNPPDESLTQYVRHVLYQQAVKGRWNMSAELQKKKSVYECRATALGTACSSKSY
jgi:hypothetical protein